MVATSGAMDVAQVEKVLLIVDMLPNLSWFEAGVESDLQLLGTRALLALGSQLFNGDCVAALTAAPGFAAARHVQKMSLDLSRPALFAAHSV
jgi:hypothetical protein